MPRIITNVILVGLSLLLLVANFKVLMPRLSVWRSTAKMDGLSLKIIGPGIEGPVWLDDQMDHGTDIPMPSSMIPDIPEEGFHRLSVEL